MDLIASIGSTSIDIRLTTPSIIHITSSKKERHEILQQISWIGSTFQVSKRNRIVYCGAEVARGRRPLRTYTIRFRQHDIPKEERSCWHHLFYDNVIARGFGIPPQGREVGLEIPLDMMAALVGVRHAVEFEGGILLKGFVSMLVPTELHKGSVQWHLVQSEDGERLPYWKVHTLCPTRLSLADMDFERMQNTRAFLGWCTSVETRLGVSDAEYGCIDYSNAMEAGRTPRISGASIGFQSFGAGELNFSLGPRDGKFHIARKGPFQKILQCAERTPVVLYDKDEKRGWMVPASHVVLHIILTRHAREPYGEHEPIKFIYADPARDGVKAAVKALKRNALTQISENFVPGGPHFYFSNLVQDTWSLLECLLDRNTTQRSGSDVPVRVTMRSFVRGYEFIALVEEASPFRQKEAFIKKTSAGWTTLASDTDALVLFASGFKDVLRPDPLMYPSRLCPMWRTLPKDEDYLAVGIPLLLRFYDQAGSRLTHDYLTSIGLRWHSGSKPFARCRSGLQPCKCDLLQQIVHEAAMAFGRIVSPGPIDDAENGAVIFGKAGSFFKRTVEQPRVTNGIYSQPNISIEGHRSISSQSSHAIRRTRSRSSQSLISTSTRLTTPESANFERSKLYHNVHQKTGGALERVSERSDLDRTTEEKCAAESPDTENLGKCPMEASWREEKKPRYSISKASLSPSSALEEQWGLALPARPRTTERSERPLGRSPLCGWIKEGENEARSYD